MAALQTSLLTELEPVVAANLDRHLSLAKDWQPQDYVPWSRGRDFAFLGGTDWQPEDSPLDPVAQTAMIVNLLTEAVCGTSIWRRSPIPAWCRSWWPARWACPPAGPLHDGHAAAVCS